MTLPRAARHIGCDANSLKLFWSFVRKIGWIRESYSHLESSDDRAKEKAEMTARIKQLWTGLFVACLLTTTLVLLSACSDSEDNLPQASVDYTVVEEGKLTVASSLNAAPYEYLQDETPTGFDIAIITEVAKRLGLEVSIQNTALNSVISSVVNHQVDVGASALAITEANKEQVDFTQTYYISDQCICVLANSGLTFADLAEQTIAAPAYTSSLAYAQKQFGETVQSLSDTNACFAALEAGDVQVIVVDWAAANWVLDQHPDCMILEMVATGEQFGFAVNKDNQGLIQAINDTLAEMQADGTLQRIQEEYNIQ